MQYNLSNDVNCLVSDFRWKINRKKWTKNRIENSKQIDHVLPVFVAIYFWIPFLNLWMVCTFFNDRYSREEFAFVLLRPLKMHFYVSCEKRGKKLFFDLALVFHFFSLLISLIRVQPTYLQKTKKISLKHFIDLPYSSSVCVSRSDS